MSAAWEGAQQWEAKMSRLEGLADFSDVFVDVIDNVVIPEVRGQMDTEGRGRYQRLSKSYEPRKRALYGDRPILQATGEMYRSLTVRGASHQILQVGPDAAFFGTDLRRAQFHQRGTSRMPRRKIFNLTREFKRKARDRAQRRLEEKARKVMGG